MNAATELEAVAIRLASVNAELAGSKIDESLKALSEAASSVQKAWSGSPLGYHALVYYKELDAPPAGSRFDAEWGFEPMYSNGIRGDWQEYQYDAVIDRIKDMAGNPDMGEIDDSWQSALDVFDESKDRVLSIVHAVLSEHSDEYLARVKEEVEALAPVTKTAAARAQIPSGNFVSRDSTAITAGLKLAPHQEMLATVVAARSPFQCCARLQKLAKQAASHLSVRDTLATPALMRQQGTHVFIGHGRSMAWRDLKDFLQDRLAIPWDEFNREPVAGLTNIERLVQMLDRAAFAFLILTAEDEQADGSMNARMNVIHEAGLFQGRLGFAKAIVMLEDGCTEFSNIAGLGQIRFPAGNISAKFEDVRRVLEREGLIE
jgi:predicted nucleotide-binding protein